MEGSETNPSSKVPRIPHYYGDLVRKFLLVVASVLLYATLVDKELLSFYMVVGAVGVLTMTVLAGLTSPKTRRVMMNTVLMSAVLFLLFEYFAISRYSVSKSIFDLIFILREAIAVISLTALYFSVKTLRGTPAED